MERYDFCCRRKNEFRRNVQCDTKIIVFESGDGTDLHYRETSESISAVKKDCTIVFITYFLRYRTTYIGRLRNDEWQFSKMGDSDVDHYDRHNNCIKPDIVGVPILLSKHADSCHGPTSHAGNDLLRHIANRSFGNVGNYCPFIDSSMEHIV